MKASAKSPLFRFLLVMIVAACVSAAAPVLGEGRGIDTAVSAVKPALVRIHVAEVEYDQGREVKSEASGSGVIIGKEGYIVTNHHVAGWAKTIYCTLSNKEEIEAVLVGTDPLTDIAVIKLKGEAGREFPTAEWGDSSKLGVGDQVFAMGSPLALSQSITQGVVSNIEMIMPDFLEGSMTLDGEDVGSMVKWIGHDAAIFPGNSGGPLVGTDGKIVGINEISMGLSGAIPSNIAGRISAEIIKNGRVKRGWIGMAVQSLLKSSKLDRGVLVNGVIPGAPAALAGIKAGDIVVRVAGRDIIVRFAEQLPDFNQAIAALPIGEPSDITVLRAGQEITLKVTPRDRPEAEPRPKEFKPWGICASDISVVEARERKRANQDGVLVYSLRTGGACSDAKPCLEEDDVIIEVAGKPVKNIDEFSKVTTALTAGKTEPVPVLVSFERKSEKMLTVVKIGVAELEDPGKEVRKAYIPIDTQVLTTDLAEALSVPGKTGVRVTQVYPNSAASKAGLQVGDLIVTVDGEKIEASQPEDTEVLPALIRQYKVGSTVKLGVIRKLSPVSVPVVLPESPLLPREMKKYRDNDFEFSVRDIALTDRVEEKLENNVVGVYVTEVSQGSWAALGHLQAGDIIFQVGDQTVNSVDQMRSVMEKIVAAKPETIVLRVRRGLQELFIEIEADWDGGGGKAISH